MSDEIFIDDPEILQGFITESLEHLESVEPLLIKLEDAPHDSELLNAIFRSVHSIKGSAGFLGLKKIQDLSHKMEGVLDDLRKGKRNVTPEVMDLVFETSDVLKELIENLRGDEIIDGFTTEEGKEKYNALLESINKLQGAGTAKPKKVAAKPEPKKAGEKKEAATSFEALKASGEMLKLFMVEATEHLEGIERDLLEIEKDPSSEEIVNSLFRAFHSIKGSSAYVNKNTISKFAHSTENLLNIIRSKKLPVSKDVLELLFESFDALRLLIEGINSSTDESSELHEIITGIEKKLAAKIKEIEGGEALDVEEKTIEENLEDGGEEDTDTAMVTIFLESAVQYLDSCVFCFDTLKSDKVPPDNTTNFLRSIESLKKSAEYMNFDEIVKPAELIFDTLTYVESGILSFEKEILELIDEKIEELRKRINSLRENSTTKIAKPEKLGEILVEEGVVSPSDLKGALEKQQKLGEILKANGVAKEDDIKKALEKQKKRVNTVNVSKKVEEIKTVRVDQHKIDKFMNLVGELIISRNALFYQIGKLAPDASFQDLLKEIKYTSSVINRISEDLQTNVMKMRMVPIKTVFQRFHRMVRDIARKNAKKVELKIIGEETEIDKTVAELLGDPLVHLVRNSVDHGIESPEERINKGKGENGLVILKASQEGNMIIIEIIDDGAGMDHEKIKNKAVEKGLISEDTAAAMSDKDALSLIFRAGLSTAKEVTDISGRGVGMDVVKTNITKLKGRIDLSSDLGHGSKVRIELPLTLAIIKILLVESGGEVFAMPLDPVVETVKMSPDEIVKLRGKDVISLRGEILGIAVLSELLGLDKPNESRLTVNPAFEQLEADDIEDLLNKIEAKDKNMQSLTLSDQEKIPIVIVNVMDKKIGIVVDELYQQQEIVIKPMESYLAHLPGIGGATIMGDGKVVLILDPIELVQKVTTVQ